MEFFCNETGLLRFDELRFISGGPKLLCNRRYHLIRLSCLFFARSPFSRRNLFLRLLHRAFFSKLALYLLFRERNLFERCVHLLRFAGNALYELLDLRNYKHVID